MTKPTSQLRVSTWREWVNPELVEEWIGVLVDEVKPSRGGGVEDFSPQSGRGGMPQKDRKSSRLCVCVCKRTEAWNNSGMSHVTVVPEAFEDWSR